jgi:SagB-type dehydrogenase family enzyme
LSSGFVTEDALDVLGGQPAAPLLLQLDRAGLLDRELRVGRQAWAQLLPCREPSRTPPAPPLCGLLRLNPTLLLQPDPQGLVLHAPGSWARVQLRHVGLMPLLDGLARGCSLAQAQRLVPLAPGLVEPLLLLWAWCGVLSPNEPTQANNSAWPAHEQLFHSRTRRGFAPEPLGKQAESAAPTAAAWPPGTRLQLEPDAAAALQLPLAQALGQRRSLREHRSGALPLADLSRFLWHTLAGQPRQGRPHHAYPSGGACYALRAHLVLARGEGLDTGLYAYDAAAHALLQVKPLDAAQQALLCEAAASAQCQAPPQALLVLCADYRRMQAAYGSLAYSLLLKEVGAVMQTAQLVATALGLACCPLGTGDALQFAALAGADPWALPAVGELLLGQPASAAG